jgi:predicted nucleic acid-binding protein
VPSLLSRLNSGVRHLFNRAIEAGTQMYLSAVTVGELRRGVALIRRNGIDSLL